MGRNVAGALVICAFGLAACGPTNGPSAVAVQHPVVTTTSPLGANAGPTPSQSGPAPPAFDRYGNANYDSSGTYIGGHGVGTLVDNPDAPSRPQTPSDIVRSDQRNIDSAMCREIKAGDPNAAC
jgi:hypothetical protein